MAILVGCQIPVPQLITSKTTRITKIWVETAPDVCMGEMFLGGGTRESQVAVVVPLLREMMSHEMKCHSDSPVAAHLLVSLYEVEVTTTVPLETIIT